jgi:hypothetical protein
MMSGFDRDLTMHGKQQLVVTEKNDFCLRNFICSHLVFIAALFSCSGRGKNCRGIQAPSAKPQKKSERFASGNAIFSTHFHAIKQK